MDLGDPTPSYTGPEIDDREMLARLPGALRSLLEIHNGFILYGGGLHVRGACSTPAWHSLRSAWLAEAGINRRYAALHEDDIPFAQDCVGDQFILRDHDVMRLLGETGELEPLGVSLGNFFFEVQSEPQEFLRLNPLMQFEESGSALEPGELLSIFPPYCTQEAMEGISLRAVPCAERLAFLAALSAEIADLPEGGRVRLELPE